MNRIIIDIGLDGAHTIFLQETSLSAPADLKRVILSEQTIEFQATYHSFIAACTPIAPVPLVEHFDVVVAIQAHPNDATVTRSVFANIPVRTINVKELAMPVIVRHYRDGVHIASEYADIHDVMRATNDVKRVVNGVEMGMFDYLDMLAETYPIKTIMRGMIGEDAEAGRWNPTL